MYVRLLNMKHFRSLKFGCRHDIVVATLSAVPRNFTFFDMLLELRFPKLSNSSHRAINESHGAHPGCLVFMAFTFCMRNQLTIERCNEAAWCESNNTPGGQPKKRLRLRMTRITFQFNSRFFLCGNTEAKPSFSVSWKLHVHVHHHLASTKQSVDVRDHNDHILQSTHTYFVIKKTRRRPGRATQKLHPPIRHHFLDVPFNFGILLFLQTFEIRGVIP